MLAWSHCIWQTWTQLNQHWIIGLNRVHLSCTVGQPSAYIESPAIKFSFTGTLETSGHALSPPSLSFFPLSLHFLDFLFTSLRCSRCTSDFRGGWISFDKSWSKEPKMAQDGPRWPKMAQDPTSRDPNISQLQTWSEPWSETTHPPEMPT